MNIVPSGEARATSNSTHETPEASLGKVADSKPADGSAGGSQSQGPLLADVSVTSSTAASAEGQDVNQASFKTATSEVKSTSGDEDKYGDVSGNSQDKPGEIMSPQDLSHLQRSMSLHNPVWDRQVPDARETQSLVVFPNDSLGKEKPPQVASAPSREPELAPSSPGAKVQSAQNAEVSPTTSAAEKSAVDANGQLDLQATSVPEAAEKAEGSKASNPGTEALPSDEPPMVMEEDLVDSSRDPQPWPSPPSPGGSTPNSPDPYQVALGRRLLDSNLYMASEDDYMRSMTSLLGGGEGTTSSLADILVWPDTTVAMGVAVGLLASDHSSVTDLLHSAGPSLRSVSSLLGSARSAFSSGLASGTSSALRLVTHTLGTVERRTLQGLRSALRYLTSHLTPRRARAGPNCE
ncbi:PREDICTED: uncharacterized protein C2orf57-like [Galeopterus variegatus]|uniref:Uncharacterized protein C2orf57-like n=1 Tax=Galeopterus variegatus TaxID=482537 RepID=A0ABM0Q2Y2_GALVR|nr:PREDICTED: uncharacterized protein C2orf57-like [Galeopterus variegatus]XP_008563307.1 PREDICTED: uncharacterized protein C2orf57-like [Galeopterus variegatus]